ncbi:MAG: hypothetical protein II304_07395 [Bacteroidales bacterium]|nr:hypothetical protein [Bacteroidales bacterium]
MENILTCKHCNKELGSINFKVFSSYYKGYDDKGKRKLFCNEDCYNAYTKQFQIEEHNGKPIYKVDVNGESRYMPYWFSPYYFTTVEDCRKRIDATNIAILSCGLKEVGI